MTAALDAKNASSKLLANVSSVSPLEDARKVMPLNAFRLYVSPSYRVLINRALAARLSQTD
jgi:hypothetical protein